ncbi:MAG: hypothetical protein IJ249_07325 [Paludibacteraceae bacterium]|nr:hypothetical protein [Paludibacteraceae bacterium]
MRRIFFSFLAFMASVTTLMADDCITPSTATATVTLIRRTGEFSINGSGGKVSFSPGNLQYRASTNTWRFAPQQYAVVGNAVGNTNPTSTQSGWIDLFGWATSGNSASGDSFHPWDTDTNNEHYGPTNLNDGDDWTAANSDWGVVNAAQLGSGWRTLKKSEWDYLVNTRSASTVNGTANARYAKATVNNQVGLILFPDTYTHPAGVKDPTNINTSTAAFNSNTYSAEEWRQMEAVGAVFLPVEGYRNGTSFSDENSWGLYWSSTSAWTTGAYDLCINPGNVAADHWWNRYGGFSVRLVQDL